MTHTEATGIKKWVVGSAIGITVGLALHGVAMSNSISELKTEFRFIVRDVERNRAAIRRLRQDESADEPQS